jgi:hypothetical protein
MVGVEGVVVLEMVEQVLEEMVEVLHQIRVLVVVERVVVVG